MNEEDILKDLQKTLESIAYRKNREKALNLGTHTDFRREITRLREKWNIPPEGFGKDDKGLGRWKKRLQKISWEKRKSPEFLEKLYRLDERRKALEESQNPNDFMAFRLMPDSYKRLYLTIPLNGFRNDVVKLRSKFKLPNSWETELRMSLLVGGNPSAVSVISYDRNIQLTRNKDTGEPELWLRIYGNTALEDIKDMWPLIKCWQEELLDYEEGRFKEKPYRDRDRKIYELRKEGKSYSEIVWAMKEEEGWTIGEDHARQIVKRYKKSIGE